MASKKSSYTKKSKKIMAKNAFFKRYGKFMVKVNNRMTDIGEYYINFLKSLDKSAEFQKYSQNIVNNSCQWNNIRRKHITASEVKKLCCWKESSDYIYSCVSRYISGKNQNRGMVLEDYIRSLMELDGYICGFVNRLWIHKSILWLSCTTDAAILREDVVEAAVEIKTFNSIRSLQSTVIVVNGSKEVNKNSRAYYQIQMIMEIVDVPYLVFIYEYNLKIEKVIVKRDLGFL